MKLLILTQKVDINDDDLGFFHEWLEEFSKHFERVIVICLEKSEYNLPANVKVLSLGKEKLEIGNPFPAGFGNWKLEIWKNFKYTFKFYKYIWRERNNYDKVLVHMNKEYVILGGLLWKFWHKKIFLWYTHKAVGWQLRLAEKMADIIFTASRESFRLPSAKVKVMGHGININKFQIPNSLALPTVAGNGAGKFQNSKYRIITIGRISPSKDYETLIKAVEALKKSNIKFSINIIGGVGTPEQNVYLESLKKMVKDKNLEGIVNFQGSVPAKDRFKYFMSGDVFVHMSLTGSLDKTVLEAMASGLPVISCNDASFALLNKYKDDLLFEKGDYVELARKLENIYKWNIDKRNKITKELRQIVIENHNLKNLIKNIVLICGKS